METGCPTVMGSMDFDDTENRIDEASQPLLEALKEKIPELEKLHGQVSGHWGAEDFFYRFYHQSWKVFGLQHHTWQIVEALAEIQPERSFNGFFAKIVSDGTGWEFRMSDNRNWMKKGRPILEAFFYASKMLEFALKYGRELKNAPTMMPRGWAAFRLLYAGKRESATEISDLFELHVEEESDDPADDERRFPL